MTSPPLDIVVADGHRRASGPPEFVAGRPGRRWYRPAPDNSEHRKPEPKGILSGTSVRTGRPWPGRRALLRGQREAVKPAARGRISRIGPVDSTAKVLLGSRWGPGHACGGATTCRHGTTADRIHWTPSHSGRDGPPAVSGIRGPERAVDTVQMGGSVPGRPSPRRGRSPSLRPWCDVSRPAQVRPADVRTPNCLSPSSFPFASEIAAAWSVWP